MSFFKATDKGKIGGFFFVNKTVLEIYWNPSFGDEVVTHLNPKQKHHEVNPYFTTLLSIIYFHSFFAERKP